MCCYRQVMALVLFHYLCHYLYCSHITSKQHYILRVRLSSDRDMMQVDICCVVLVMYSGVLCGAEVMYSGVLCSVGHVQWCVVAYRSCTVVCCVV
jgi:hypothetical protein